MKKVLFSSLDGGVAHREQILSMLFEAHIRARSISGWVDVQIMTFAFTDPEIADAVRNLAESCPNVSIRVIADWSQGASHSPSVVPGLASAGCDRMSVRFKLDLPYFADKKSGKVLWGYHTSHGMLHHKTMLISVNGKAEQLLLGSFNWSARGMTSYENTMMLPRDASTAVVLDAFQAEFDALWNDDCVTAGKEDASELAQLARQKVQEGGNMHQLDDLRDVLASRAAETEPRSGAMIADGPILPAFAGRHLTSRQAHYGFAPSNNRRNLDLLRPSGSRRAAPMSVNAVALEAIRSVQPGDPIKVAMYAMSPRVPEFGALLEAARRGCPIEVLLDRKIGKDMAAGLSDKAKDEGLPIQVRAANRRMHQKYIVAPASNMVVTGTANMTMDSTHRHAEHRILFRDDTYLAGRFNEDFETIWRRLG